MNGGAKFLACTALLTIAACGGESGKLEIRSMPTPLAQGKRPVPFRIAEAAQQFALGNTALALESYRKAWRDDPNSLEALAGIAACYDRMGRFDLSRRHYEAALAIEPHNTAILTMLATSLDQQGKSLEANAVRGEIGQRLAAAGRPAEAPLPVAVADVPAPVAEAQAEVPLRAPQLAATFPVAAAAPLAVSMAAAAPAAVMAVFAPDEPETRAAPQPAQPIALAQAAPAAGPSVTIKLPAPRPAAPAEAARPVTAMSAAAPEVPLQRAPEPAKASPILNEAVVRAKPSQQPAPLRVAAGPGPRLERTSLGEVALITQARPQWSSVLVKTGQRSATVRFVPLREANARLASVRLLNAARVRGLAARTRSTLYDRGWRGIAIGDAGAIRARSLVLYPAHRRSTALSLARQFGFAAAQRASGREITVLLGRDSTVRTRRSPGA